MITRFRNRKKYKGSIQWSKKRLKDGSMIIRKERPFGIDSYSITKAEFDYIDNRDKAELIWAYKHFGVNASCEIKHPLTGLTAMETYLQNQEATNE